MDANDHQISEDAGDVGTAAGVGGPECLSEASEQIAGSIPSESSLRRDDSSPTPIADPASPKPEREISLLEFKPIPNFPESVSSSDHPTKRFRPNFAAIGLVAGLGCLLYMGAVIGYDRVQYSHLLAAKIHDSQNLASAINGLKGRLDAMEADRDKDESTDLRRVLSEMRASAAATRDFGTSLAQLSSRVDHVEKDQSARLDKLGDRIDHEASARLADMTARLDKLEKRPAYPIVASAPPKATQSLTISNETTGSVERPKPRLRGFTVADVRDGYAVVDSRQGPQPVVAGDFIPGAGRVLRIERHGNDWAVVTTQGIITEEMAPY
jgi:hypothetical protein